MANLKNLRWQMTKVQNLPVQPKLVPRVLGLKLWHPLNLRKWVRNLAESRGRYTVLCEQFSQAGTVFTCYIYGIHSRLSLKYYKISLTFKSKKYTLHLSQRNLVKRFFYILVCITHHLSDSSRLQLNFPIKHGLHISTLFCAFFSDWTKLMTHKTMSI